MNAAKVITVKMYSSELGFIVAAAKIYSHGRVVGYFIQGTSRPAFEDALEKEVASSLMGLIAETKLYQNEVHRELLFGFDIDGDTSEYRCVTANDRGPCEALVSKLQAWFSAWGERASV